LLALAAPAQTKQADPSSKALVEVMVLATYHMANPDHDAVNM
jgi:hypothetical protein